MDNLSAYGSKSHGKPLYIRADGRPDANGNGLVLAEVRVKFCSDAVVATVTKASTPFASNEFVLGSPRYGDVYLAAALALVLREVAGSMFFCATANKQSVLARTAVP